MSVTSTKATGAESFTDEQKNYLEGFFSGIKARGVSFGASSAAPESPQEDETKEERIKREVPPFEAYASLLEDARRNAPPEPENIFRFKWNGLFWLNPVKDGYMCRLRIPGGILQSHQLRELAAIAEDLTTGYIQITTRANFQMRTIEPKNCPEVLRRIQSCGLHSRGAGADNIRNITCSPTTGVDPYELLDVRPLVQELSQRIISGNEFYNLPRKFNIAIDGGGLISCVEDTNDIGVSAVRIGANDLGLAPGVYFRLALGGATGLKSFASDAGVVVPPERLIEVMVAILRVFVRDGDRTNRKRARLKYLIEKRGLEGFRGDFEALLGGPLPRVAADAAFQSRPERPPCAHPHIGAYPQKNGALHYMGATVPVGQLTGRQLRRIAELAENYGSGEVRLTVWQNIVIPNVPAGFVKTLEKQLQRIGMDTAQSAVSGGFVACTGNKYCKYAATDTKGHAIELMKWLDKRIILDQPINIHLTGCPHSCAQHYMGDIGLLGAAVKSHGETVEGYHVFLGGGFGGRQALGRQVFSNIPFNDLKPLLETMMKTYMAARKNRETFQDFCIRHEVGVLQEIFTNG